MARQFPRSVLLLLLGRSTERQTLEMRACTRVRDDYRVNVYEIKRQCKRIWRQRRNSVIRNYDSTRQHALIFPPA